LSVVPPQGQQTIENDAVPSHFAKLVLCEQLVELSVMPKRMNALVRSNLNYVNQRFLIGMLSFEMLSFGTMSFAMH
jgi:hypothetical protein